MTKQNNQLGLKQGDLTFEIRRMPQSQLLRRTVSRRMAFHDVRYIDVVAALQIDGQQHRIKESTRLPDKRLALFILSAPRPFADKQPVGLLITDARNNQLAPVQSAQARHSAILWRNSVQPTDAS